jgi:hypothetical protein
MTEDEVKSAAERLLDALVFAPAGLALTAAEEFPRLAEKGKHRIEGQVNTARVVGQFVVQMARSQLEQTLRRPTPPKSPPSPSPGGPTNVSNRVEADVEGGAGDEGSGSSGSEARRLVPGPAPAGGATNGTASADELAIPGYDTLSASQVVQRLGGLSLHELEEVRTHEVGHRHRRTILNRVDQLLNVGTAGPADHVGADAQVDATPPD